MPVTDVEKLILVEAKEIEFKDKESEGMVKKWKYKFLNEKMEFVIGYDDEGRFKNDVQTVSGWDITKARNYIWELKEFRGQTRRSLATENL